IRPWQLMAVPAVPLDIWLTAISAVRPHHQSLPPVWALNNSVPGPGFSSKAGASASFLDLIQLRWRPYFLHFLSCLSASSMGRGAGLTLLTRGVESGSSHQHWNEATLPHYSAPEATANDVVVIEVMLNRRRIEKDGL
uniref:Uncharacterized protein n=1 Tax=Chelonoidis abingdonii TaxID=106734 RepID=A0A8C0GIK0_CHEAB